MARLPVSKRELVTTSFLNLAFKAWMDLNTTESTPALESDSNPPRDGSAQIASDSSSQSLVRLRKVVIESEAAGVQLNLEDLWDFRELLYFLTVRDIKVRYKQTVLGAAWVVVQPLFMMLIVTLVFNRFVRLDTGSIPYPIFAYSGLLIWIFFSNAVVNGTNSLTANTSLITKVYFPRIFIPAAAVAAGLVDLAIASLVLIALVAYYGMPITWTVLLLPVFAMLATMLALSVGVLVSALTVKYRDLRHALPFILQFWMFASPVIYPSSIVPERWRWILIANPLAVILDGVRGALTGDVIDTRGFTVAVVVICVLLVFAVYIFRRTEDTFADVI